MPASQTEDIDVLRQRLARVEAEVANLKQQLHPPSGPAVVRGWMQHAGTFAGDSGFDEMVRLGREWRDADRERAGKQADDTAGTNDGA